MGDFDFTGAPQGDDRYSRAKRGQGFSEPTDRSPFQNPPGWHGGAVRQTGGMVMVREWATLPLSQLFGTYDQRPGRKHEYEVAYGDQPGTSIQRYVWNPDAFDPQGRVVQQHGGGTGAYEFDDVVEKVPVSPNTDKAKARAARELMRKHSGKTR